MKQVVAYLLSKQHIIINGLFYSAAMYGSTVLCWPLLGVNALYVVGASAGLMAARHLMKPSEVISPYSYMKGLDNVKQGILRISNKINTTYQQALATIKRTSRLLMKLNEYYQRLEKIYKKTEVMYHRMESMHQQTVKRDECSDDYLHDSRKHYDTIINRNAETATTHRLVVESIKQVQAQHDSVDAQMTTLNNRREKLAVNRSEHSAHCGQLHERLSLLTSRTQQLTARAKQAPYALLLKGMEVEYKK